MVGIESDLLGRYLCSVFVDCQSLRGNPGFVIDMIELAVASKLFPLPPGTAANPPLFVAIDEYATRSLQVHDQRIDYQLMGVPSVERNLPVATLNQFIDESAALVDKVLRVAGRVGYRVALVSESFATLDRPRTRTVDDVRRRLLNIPEGWGPSELTEWTWKYSLRRQHGDEGYNLLATVQTAVGAIANRPLTGLWVQLDANTSPEQVTLRFGEGDLSAAMANLVTMHAQLGQELGQLTGDF